MANYSVGGYAQNAFMVTPEGKVVLDPSFDASEDAYRWDIQEDDGGVKFDGDDNGYGDEIGDNDQIAKKYDAQGNLLAEGNVYLEESWTLTDEDGNEIKLYKVESNGQHSGWVADGEIIPGKSYDYSGPDDVNTANQPRYDALHDPSYDPDDANDYEGGNYSDYAYTGADDDTVSTGAGNDRIQSGDGDDSVDGGTGHDTISGGSGDDTLKGGSGNDSVSGGTGHDSIVGGSGNDSLSGGEGNDTLHGGSGDDTLDGGAGNDTLNGGAGNDQIAGGSGDDKISGGDGSDTIDGGDGNDTIYFGKGGDSVSGGEGNDVIDEQAGSPDWDYDDTIDGGAGDDTVYAGWGDDSIDGGADDDALYGDAGDDTIHGGSGDDYVSGGLGNDQISGDEGHDHLRGKEGDDTVDGGAGDDTIDGGEGHDNLSGGAGDDSIDGGDGDDTITGGDGNDTIDGGTGSNTLTGGAGDDTFVQSQDAHSVVTDFDLGDTDGDGRYNDQLDVSDLRTLDGDPVRVQDVVVSDDGNGNARLTFPEGESIVLQGVSPDQMSQSSQLTAAGIPCFTAGTRIATARGPVPVEAVQPGDLVQTRDNGLRPVIWAGQRTVGAAELAANASLRPIHIAAGAFGNARPIRVSRQHALALGYRDSAGSCLLVRAGHLARLAGGLVRVAGGVRTVTYVHLLLESHDLIVAEGLVSESLYPGPWGLLALGTDATRDLIRCLPALAHSPVAQAYGPTVHPVARFGALPPAVHDLRATA
ncbi:MAG: Hint domain-containing protein [Pseudomonadota bacterium]